MRPIIAIVGRPNVGKSTLFNRLMKRQNAIIVDMPGVTRDRQYGDGAVGTKPFIVIDTGGIGCEENGLDEFMSSQSQMAMVEANIIFFVVDAKDGLTTVDEQLAQNLRQYEKKVILVVNKVDGKPQDLVLADFYRLGLGDPQPIAASQGRGIHQLIDHALEEYPEPPEEGFEYDEEGNLVEIDLSTILEDKKDRPIKICIAGRPNVGKSTLMNRILGYERVVVFDQPGTTRDSIYVDFSRHGRNYTLIDTAGVRRKSRTHETLEKFSILKTLQAVQDANVVLMVLDASAELFDQDMQILNYVIESGTALVVVANKWDNLDEEHRDKFKKTLKDKLQFADFARFHFISALHGSGVGNLFESIHEAYDAAMRTLSTSSLTRLLIAAIEKHPPPLVNGRRIKLRYAHCGGHNPPIIVLHGNQTDSIPPSYLRYLENFFTDALKMTGTPLRLICKSGENPYAGKRNVLTERQQRRKKRNMDFYKGMEKSKKLKKHRDKTK